MRRTFFDKMIIIILLIVISSFLLFAVYMTKSTKKVLIAQKQENLVNEAQLLLNQSILRYYEGNVDKEYLQYRFNEYRNCLYTDVWFYGSDGKLIVASEDQDKIIEDISEINQDNNIEKGFFSTGDFFGCFDTPMISVLIPVPVIKANDVQGYLILHTNLDEIDQMQGDMIRIVYLPFFIMLLLIVLVLVYFSGTVLRPISKINLTAREYAKGNFDEKTGVRRDDEIGELAESLENMAGELSKLDEYRKEFIANISHDFRSPLTSIKGYLEAMLDGTIPVEKYDRYLNIVLTESQRLTKLTSGLLELNDFDTFGPVLKKSQFDITQVAYEVRNTFEGRCADKKIGIDLDCPENGAIVYADRMKIGQVVYNLVDNAIKFSPEGGTVYVAIVEKGDRVFVSVRDEGPGIEKDKQNKVFDRFYKTDPSRGKDKQGTGLGLAITKEIIRAHGENIDLVSTEGIGTKFLFTLRTKPE